MTAISTDFASRVNLFLYRQHIRRLAPTDRDLARTWAVAFIRREHPQMTDEEIDRFYESLIHVHYINVDEWTQRMS